MLRMAHGAMQAQVQQFLDVSHRSASKQVCDSLASCTRDTLFTPLITTLVEFGEAILNNP